MAKIIFQGIGQHSILPEYTVLHFYVDDQPWQDTVILPGNTPPQAWLELHAARYAAEITDRLKAYTGRVTTEDGEVEISLYDHMRPMPRSFGDLSRITTARKEAAIWALKEAAKTENASEILKSEALKMT